jgi:hypothetical protein
LVAGDGEDVPCGPHLAAAAVAQIVEIGDDCRPGGGDGVESVGLSVVPQPLG